MYSNTKMLRTSPVSQFSLTTDNLAYLQVGEQHQLAVDTLRKLPGYHYKLDPEGIPKIDRLNIGNRDKRQSEVREFAAGIYGLNGLWERLITDRPTFHHELTQFPHPGYRRKSLISEVNNQPAKAPKIIEVNSGEDESTKTDIGTLGSTMDTSAEARTRRLEHSIESKKWHAYLRMEPYFNIFGTFGLFMPDIGYALSILGAFGVGMKHLDPKVRKSSIEILNAITQGTIVKLHIDLEQTDTNNENTLKQAYIQDARSVLNGILNLLHCEGFGTHDNNEEVQSLATNLESNLIDANVFILRLTKSHVIDPAKVMHC